MKHQQMIPATPTQTPIHHLTIGPKSPIKPQLINSSKGHFGTLYNPFSQDNLHQTQTLYLLLPQTHQHINQHQTPPLTPIIIMTQPTPIDKQMMLPDLQPLLIQQPIQPERHNRPWGDTTIFSCPTQNFRVVLKNTGTLNPFTLNMLALTDELISKGMSMFAAQERNTHWNPNMTQLICSQVQRNTLHLSLTTSTSTEESSDWNKVGGTFFLALNKWMSWILEKDADNPLGQWSYIELVGKHGKCLVIVSAYQVCHQKFDMALDTVLAQQIQLL